jgi:hypothetical protein
MAIRSEHEDVRHVVGLATLPKRQGLAIDIGYVDGSRWTSIEQQLGEELKHLTGLYKSPKVTALGGAADPLMSPPQRQRARNQRKRLRRERGK